MHRAAVTEPLESAQSGTSGRTQRRGKTVNPQEKKKKKKEVRICHTVIPFEKCRPINTLKDLLASCSANVGQYQGIKQEGWGVCVCVCGGGVDYDCATTAAAAKSTVSHPRRHPTTRPASCPRADGNSFPADARLDDTGRAEPGRAGTQYWQPVLFNLTHIHKPQLDAANQKQAGFHRLVWCYPERLLMFAEY